MADFAIQRGQSQIANSSTTVTISAGTEYTAPASATAAFIRIVGSVQSGGGQQGSDTSAEIDNSFIQIQNPGNILTSITFEAAAALDSGAVDLEWEIIEYTGAGGGANEMIVRLTEVLVTSSDTDTTIDSGTLSPTTAGDVVVFVTGTNSPSTSTNDTEEIGFTAEYISGSTLARVTRGPTVDAQGGCSIAAVEFTGSNWVIQRIAHSYSSAATEETETITTVGAVTKAFVHHQSRFSGDGAGAGSAGQECWISSTTQVTFKKEILGAGGAGADGVAWVMENTQSDGTPLLTAQFNGTRAGGTGGDPDSFTQAVTSQTLAESSVMGEGANTTAPGQSNRVLLGFRLTAADTVTMQRGRDASNRDWRFEHVRWPTVAAGGALPIPPKLHSFAVQRAANY